MVCIVQKLMGVNSVEKEKEKVGETRTAEWSLRISVD